MKFRILLLLILFLAGCNDKLTNPDTSVKIYQLGKCNSNNLSKVTTDSLCFNYKFENSLVLDFCVKGNCCPDSNRFIFNYKINENRIDIFVDDIAPNLCKCICTYTIHAEVTGLSNQKYLITCYLKNNDDYVFIHKKEIVKH